MFIFILKNIIFRFLIDLIFSRFKIGHIVNNQPKVKNMNTTEYKDRSIRLTIIYLSFFLILIILV